MGAPQRERNLAELVCQQLPQNQQRPSEQAPMGALVRSRPRCDWSGRRFPYGSPTRIAFSVGRQYKDGGGIVTHAGRRSNTGVLGTVGEHCWPGPSGRVLHLNCLLSGEGEALLSCVPMQGGRGLAFNSADPSVLSNTVA
ncbi:hypothetical protein DPEC_G00344150 [Dallia pectoralis]|uniref:Uncharacterized protein n=1 Tax=Dallia pectoralis TaxID=75939 RepID=A0ACC2F361_DALPE|nr:hypothetical protein DPEC_G00344150 [Dallia pectoralis]